MFGHLALSFWLSKQEEYHYELKLYKSLYHFTSPHWAKFQNSSCRFAWRTVWYGEVQCGNVLLVLLALEHI